MAGLIGDSYTINLYVKTTDFGEKTWARIIDFSEGNNDGGVYFRSNGGADRCLDFYPNGVVGACPYFNNKEYYLLTFTRNGISGIIDIYVNSVLFSSYNDVAGNYKGTKGKPIYIFRDDKSVTCESGEANFAYLSFGNTYSSKQEVSAVFNNICSIANSKLADFSSSQSIICQQDGTTLIKYEGNADLSDSRYKFNWDFDRATVVSGTGHGPFSLKWPTSGKKKVSLSVSYRGCSPEEQKKSVEVEVSAPVTPSVKIGTSNSVFCGGQPVTFFATAENGGSLPVFKWYVNGVEASGTGATFTTPDLKTGDLVTCIMTSNLPCLSQADALSNTISVRLEAKLNPKITIESVPTTACQGAIINFKANLSDAGISPSLSWLVNGAPSGVSSITFSGAGLQPGDKVSCELTASSPCQPAIVILSEAITVSLLPKLTPDLRILADKVEACKGEIITFTATAVNGGLQPAFSWFVNGIPAGKNDPFFTAALDNKDVVSCKLVSSEQCLSSPDALSNSVAVIIHPLVNPAVIISASRNQVCKDLPVIFSALVSDAAEVSGYEWLVNNRPQLVNAAEITLSSLSNGDIVSCRVLAKSKCSGSMYVLSNVIEMVIKENAATDFQITAIENGVCEGKMVLFKASYQGAVPASYEWLVNGKISGQSGDTFSGNSLSDGDLVSCHLTANGLCTPISLISNSIRVLIYPLPLISAGADKTIQLGEKVQLEGKASAGDMLIRWSPLEGLSDPFVLSPVASPEKTTLYKLTVTGIGGCERSTFVTVNVLEEILIPNAFTPNGDGVNDVWRIANLEFYSNSSVRIFNRWGQLVYTSTGIYKPWSGNSKNGPAPVGVYYYIIDLNGDKKKLTGQLTLIR